MPKTNIQLMSYIRVVLENLLSEEDAQNTRLVILTHTMTHVCVMGYLTYTTRLRGGGEMNASLSLYILHWYDKSRHDFGKQSYSLGTVSVRCLIDIKLSEFSSFM